MPILAIPLRFPLPSIFSLKTSVIGMIRSFVIQTGFFFLLGFPPFLICHNLHSTDLTIFSYKVLQMSANSQSVIHRLDCKTVLKVTKLPPAPDPSNMWSGFHVYTFVFSRTLFHAVSSVQILCCDSCVSQGVPKAYLSWLAFYKLHLHGDSCVPSCVFSHSPGEGYWVDPFF